MPSFQVALIASLVTHEEHADDRAEMPTATRRAGLCSFAAGGSPPRDGAASCRSRATRGERAR